MSKWDRSKGSTFFLLCRFSQLLLFILFSAVCPESRWLQQAEWHFWVIVKKSPSNARNTFWEERSCWTFTAVFKNTRGFVCAAVYLNKSRALWTTDVHKRNQCSHSLRTQPAMSTLFIFIMAARRISPVCVSSHGQCSFAKVFPMLTKPNSQILQPAANCSHFFNLSRHHLRAELSLQQTATHCPRTRSCVMIAGKALRYKSILACILSPGGQRIFLEHLPKSDMFDSFSSPPPRVLHTPSFWCWSLSPGERKKGEDRCNGLSGTQASSENSVKPGRERASECISLFSSI